MLTGDGSERSGDEAIRCSEALKHWMGFRQSYHDDLRSIEISSRGAKCSFCYCHPKLNHVIRLMFLHSDSGCRVH